MPDDYYVSQYSGEEIDALLGGAGAGTVRYDAAQSLTDAQKAQARTNIGADAVQGAVRYDAAQTLTDAQKQQARGNIGAAPDGFGLGSGAKQLTGADDLNTTLLGGWYFYWKPDIPQNAPNGINYCRMRVDPGYNNGVSWTRQTIMDAANGVEQTRWLEDHNGWQPWEYVNPPLTLGVEYRTTERYQGKPVYTMAFSFGALPNATEKEVAMPGTDNTCVIFEIHGYSTNRMTLPGVSGTAPGLEISLTGLGNKAYIITEVDRSSATAVIVAKYFKTTD